MRLPAGRPSWLPDGRVLLWDRDGGRIVVAADRRQGPVILEIKVPGARSVSVAPDGRRAAAQGVDLQVFSLDDGALEASSTVQGEWAVWAPDGTALLVGGTAPTGLVAPGEDRVGYLGPRPPIILRGEEVAWQPGFGS